jgi:TRAP transporter TAXI family solute receptor
LRQPLLATVALVLGLIGLSVLGYYIATLPTTLRIAVGPVTNENVRIVTATIQTLQREREPFRLRLVLTEGTTQTSAALDAGKADLALVRTDISYPRSGATVAVMHVDHAILVAPAGGANSVAELGGKSVALFRDNPGSRGLLKIFAQQAGLGEDAITGASIRQADLKSALEQGKVAGVLVVGPITSRLVFDIVNIVAEAGSGDISFIPINETSAIEQRFPLIEADTIVRGSFGGPKPRPEKDVPTVTVSHQLLAAKSLSDATVADFTRVLLNAKAQIAVEAPLAARMEAPDQEKASPIPIHPGTITYIDGQTTTFLERYGDWFYIAIMFLGLGGSALAGWLSVRGARAREGVMSMLAALEKLGAEARAAPDATALAVVDKEADQIFSRTMREAAKNNLDASAMMAFTMAFSHVREAVVSRRDGLSDSSSSG